MNVYLLCYDPLITDPTPQRVVEFVRAHAFTVEFLMPFHGTIFIKSELSLSQVTNGYQSFFEPNAFFMSQVNPAKERIGGFAYQSVWDWINGAPALPQQVQS